MMMIKEEKIHYRLHACHCYMISFDEKNFRVLKYDFAWKSFAFSWFKITKDKLSWIWPSKYWKLHNRKRM